MIMMIRYFKSSSNTEVYRVLSQKLIKTHILFSVPSLVFELAQITSQKRFDGGYVIFEPSTTFLGTSYGQIVVAVFT